MSEKLDITPLNDAAIELQRAFETGDRKHLERLVALVTPLLVVNDEKLRVQRADQIILPPQADFFISSGVEWFDTFLAGGLRKEELVVVGGAPHQGKTHLLGYIAASYIKAQPTFKVLHFNGEDILGDIMDIYEHALSDEEQLQRLFIADVKQARFTPTTVDLALRETPVDIVVIDHLDIMQTGTDAADWLAVSETTRELRFLAKKYNVIMLVGSQLNFIDENAEQPKSGMFRFFRAKVGKASHADVVLIIERSNQGKLTMELAKARGRRIFNKYMLWNCNFDTMTISGEVLS
jgi:replicative DNA helicase